MTHTLVTAATTRFSPEGRLPETDGATASAANNPISWVLYLASTRQMAPPLISCTYALPLSMLTINMLMMMTMMMMMKVN